MLVDECGGLAVAHGQVSSSERGPFGDQSLEVAVEVEFAEECLDFVCGFDIGSAAVCDFDAPLDTPAGDAGFDLLGVDAYAERGKCVVGKAL